MCTCWQSYMGTRFGLAVQGWYRHCTGFSLGSATELTMW